MDKNLDEIYDRFMADLKERYPPSKAARILEIFDYLENARKQGARVSDLCYFLKQLDIDVSEKYLPKVMYRIRKEKGISKQKSKQKQQENQQTVSSVQANKKPELLTSEKTSSTAKNEKEPYDHIKHLPVNEKYAYVKRFKKVNGKIDFFVGTPEEEYYSLGGDPDERFEKLHVRDKKLAVTKLFNKINRQKHIYHNYSE